MNVQSKSAGKAEPGFAAPSPLAVPALGADDVDGLEILEEDSDESGWQRLITSQPNGDDDVIIELD